MIETRNGTALYTSRDLIIYAVGIGCTSSESTEMKYLYEHDVKFTAFPTFLLTLPFRSLCSEQIDCQSVFSPANFFRMPPFPPPLMKPYSFINSNDETTNTTTTGPVIHLSEKFRLHEPIPVPSTALSVGSVPVDIRTRVVGYQNSHRGSIVITETQYHVPASQSAHNSSDSKKTMKRSDCKLLGTAQSAILYPQKIPESLKQCMLPTKMSTLQPINLQTANLKEKSYIVTRFSINNDQALIYRLSGDTNAIHVTGSPELFHTKQPILHGLCTLGYAVRAIMSSCDCTATGEVHCKYVECRFKKPVFVGDEIEVRTWEVANELIKNEGNGLNPSDDRVFVFEIWNLNHDTIVVDRGIASVGPTLNDTKNSKLSSKL